MPSLIIACFPRNRDSAVLKNRRGMKQRTVMLAAIKAMTQPNPIGFVLCFEADLAAQAATGRGFHLKPQLPLIIRHSKTKSNRRQLCCCLVCDAAICEGKGKVAGEPGFEPGLTESESVGLPLTYSPTKLGPPGAICVAVWAAMYKTRPVLATPFLFPSVQPCDYRIRDLPCGGLSLHSYS